MDPHLEGRVRNRLAKARQKLGAAERLLAAGDWDDSISRAYYAACHAALALLLTVGLEPRSHDATISLFGLHFVKAGQLDPALGKALRAVREDRENGDYAEISFFDEADARARLDDARRLVQAAADLLAREHGLAGL
jgi:uncharacterized protein (UPF0332 family)